MDESYGTDVDDEYVDDHDYDDADDDTDDDKDHKKDSYIYIYIYIYCCWCCSHQDQATSGGYFRSRFIPNSSRGSMSGHDPVVDALDTISDRV